MDPQDCFIFVIRKSHIWQKLAQGHVIFVPTGWCNNLLLESEPRHFV